LGSIVANSSLSSERVAVRVDRHRDQQVAHRGDQALLRRSEDALELVRHEHQRGCAADPGLQDPDRHPVEHVPVEVARSVPGRAVCPHVS
jgi:hypothetical protein